MLGTAGYNVVKNGLLITINDFSIVVGNACSGFRSFITLTVLGLLYIYFYASKERLSYKVILLGLIPILAIVGNSLRICCIGLLGYHFGQEVADGFLHSFSGMLVFVFMIMGLFLGTIREMTGSIWPGAVAHALNNGAALALLAIAPHHHGHQSGP